MTLVYILLWSQILALVSAGTPDSYPVNLYLFNKSSSECMQDVCVRKCCKVGFYLNSTYDCVHDDSANLSVPIFKHRTVRSRKNPAHLGYIPGFMECDKKIYMYKQIDDFMFFVQEDGRLWWNVLSRFYNLEHYCLDTDESGYLFGYICLVRREWHQLDVFHNLLYAGKMLSLPLLLITFLIYAILPTKTFFAKSLMCYMLSLIGLFSIQIFLDLVSVEMPWGSTKALLTNLTMMYFSSASFFWMNVMCIDIWLTFRGSHRFWNNPRKPEHKRFLLCSLYAWATPLLLLALMLVISRTAEPFTWYNPGIVGDQCILTKGIPTLIYLLLPRGMILTANMTLFVMTAWKLRQARLDTAFLREEQSRKSQQDSHTQRFIIDLKLLLVMGLTWLVEALYWMIEWQIENVPLLAWFLFGVCNSAFGVFIFLMFVCNRSTWRSLKRKCCEGGEKPRLVRNTSSPSDTTAF